MSIFYIYYKNVVDMMSSSFLWEDNLIDLQNGHLRNDYVQLFYQSNYRIMTENCHGRLYNNRQVG